MAKLIEITGKVLSGEWGTDDESGNGVPVLRTTNFTNEGIVDYSNVVTRTSLYFMCSPLRHTKEFKIVLIFLLCALNADILPTYQFDVRKYTVT